MTYNPEDIIVPGKRYAVIIANWEYRYFTPLRGVERDCDDLLATLKQPAAGFLQVIPLRNKSRSEAIEFIIELAQSLSPNDLLLIYFIGHGDDTHGHVLLFPRATRNGLKYGEEAARVRYLVDLISERGLHGVLIFDACRDNRDLTMSSGGGGLKTIPDITRDVSVGPRTSAGPGLYGSVTMLMSCGPNMLAHEIPDPKIGFRGLFSWAFVEYLNGQLSRGSAVLLDTGLRDAVRRQMTAFAKQYDLDACQSPDLTASKPILLVPGRMGSSQTPPDDGSTGNTTATAAKPDASLTQAAAEEATIESINRAAQLRRARDREFQKIRTVIADIQRFKDWSASPEHCQSIIARAKELIQLKPSDPWIDSLLDSLWQRAPWCLLDKSDAYEETHDLAGAVSDFYTAHFSPDGKMVCIAGESHDACIFDLEAGAFATPITGHDAFIRTARFSPDSSMLVTASADGTARVTILENRELLRVFPQPGRALCADWHPDGESILVGGDEGNLLLWSLGDLGQPGRFPGHSGRVFSCKFTRDGSTIASTGEDETLRLWDAKTFLPIGPACRHPEAVYDVAFLKNDATAITACADGHLRIVDCATMKISQVLESQQDVVWSVGAFLGDTIAASASANGKVILWDLGKLEKITVIEASKDWVRAVAISPDGNHLVSCGDGPNAALWRVKPRHADLTRSQLISQLRQGA